MAEPALPGGPTAGRLAENIVHFARALRRAGVAVGPAQVLDAVRAAEIAGFTRKADFYHVLRAALISRPEQFELFHQCFAMFWRDPEYLERMLHMLSPLMRSDKPPPARDKAAERRAAEALTDMAAAPARPRTEDTIEVAQHLAASAAETLRTRDFEQMSLAEIAEARRALRALTLPVPPVLARRRVPAAQGRIDRAATLRQALRRGGHPDRLILRAPATRPPDLVAICDISGSMATYSRMLLQFLHALRWNGPAAWGRIHAFTFGTRLTNVTRALIQKDPDAALAAAGRMATDWEGGTRIGAALRRFNVDWSRRVLGQGALVLLVTDGLERGDPAELSREAERLHLSCRRLVWLNPLLRFDGFAPRARGVQALLTHVDSFQPCHSLRSLEDLAEALSGPGDLHRMRNP